MKRTLLLFLMCVLGMRMNAIPVTLKVDPDPNKHEFSCVIYQTPTLETPDINSPWYTGTSVFTIAEGTLPFQTLNTYLMDLGYGNYVFTSEDGWGDGFVFASQYFQLEQSADTLFRVTGNWGSFETIAFALLPPPPTCTEANTGNTRTTAQVGLASSTSTWIGGIVPVDGDKVIINHAIDWDIDCQGDSITIYDLGINSAFTISGNLWCKTVTTLTPGTTLPSLTMNGCGAVEFRGDSLTVDEIIVEKADSLLFTGITIANKIWMPTEMVDMYYFQPDSLCAIGDTNSPPIIYYPTTYNMLVSGPPKTFEYPFEMIDAGWRMEGGPGISTTFADYDAHHLTSGYPASDDSTGWQNIYFYDETVIGSPTNTMNDGWIQPPFGNSTPLTHGFTAYYVQGNHIDKWTNFDIVTGDVSWGLSYTSPDLVFANVAAGGWNLFKNPFTGTINADSITTDAIPVVYVWDHVTQQYTFRNLLTQFGSHANTIPAGMPFWVKTNTTGKTLTIPQNAMMWETAEYRDEPVIANLYALTITSGATEYTTHIHRSPNGTLAVDDYDAYEMNSENANAVCPVLLYTTAQDQALAFQSLPNNTDTLYVNVAGKSMQPTSGLHSLSFTTQDEESLNWEIRWENDMEWIPFTEQLVVPDGILSTVEGPIATLRLIQVSNDPDTGHPYGWSDVVDNSVKDQNSDIVSGITETHKESIIAYCSDHNQITVGSTVEVVAIYNTLGKILPFEEINNTTFVVDSNEILLFILTKHGVVKVPMH